MNILMLSLDDSVFDAGSDFGNTRRRFQQYLAALRQHEPDSMMMIFVSTRYSYQPFSDNGIKYIPIRSARIQLLPLTALWAGWRRRHFAPDLITAQNPFEVGLAGLLLKWLLRAKLEVQIHSNICSHYWLRTHPLLNRMRQRLARLILGRADSVRTVSKLVQSYLIEQWQLDPTKVAYIPVPVIYDSVDADTGNDLSTDKAIATAALPFAETAPLVLFVGRLSFEKNLPALVRITQQLLAERTTVEIALIGDGPGREFIVQALADEDKVRLHLIRSLPYVLLPTYYRRADLLILPSLCEGFGRVVVESYLEETPAVVTRCGGPEDIVIDRESGFVVEVEAIDSFIDRVQHLLDHPQQAQEMGRRGRAYVQEKYVATHLIEQLVARWLPSSTRTE